MVVVGTQVRTHYCIVAGLLNGSSESSGSLAVGEGLERSVCAEGLESAVFFLVPRFSTVLANTNKSV